MIQIQMTSQELSNLKAFLMRTQLTGQEALEFMKIVDRLEKGEEVRDGE